MSKLSNILSNLLQKWGVDKAEDLSVEEQATLESYRRILSGETLTVDSIKEFCRAQISIIETRFASEAGTSASDTYLKACLHVYLNLLKTIEAPEAERESLERYLNQIISQP